VDCGAGTGKFAEEMLACCRVLAVDDHQESLNIARSKLGADRVLAGTCRSLPFPDASVDALTALDVLEHVEDDKAGLREFARVVKKGGVAVITVPALPALWSDWDVALHHYRRYTRKHLLSVVPLEQFEVLHCAYINVAALPAVYVVRKFRGLLQKLGFKSSRRSEDRPPGKALNTMLKFLFVKLACQTSIHFPAGVGLLAVLKRR
jgi:ubiquinone/menaquinone biosynthesis C-methylase UbiE